jgi:hypothetical protein
MESFCCNKSNRIKSLLVEHKRHEIDVRMWRFLLCILLVLKQGQRNKVTCCSVTNHARSIYGGLFAVRYFGKRAVSRFRSLKHKHAETMISLLTFCGIYMYI